MNHILLSSEGLLYKDHSALRCFWGGPTLSATLPRDFVPLNGERFENPAVFVHFFALEKCQPY